MVLSEIIQILLTGEMKSYTEQLLCAAKKGDANAQLKLGICHYTGRDLPLDEGKAVQWFHLAAKQGNAKAQFYLGRLHFSGDGTRNDRESAYAWFTMAAAGGYRKAEEWRTVVCRKMTPEEVEEGCRLARELTERQNGLQSRIPAGRNRKFRNRCAKKKGRLLSGC
jgi:hypothetical protein